MRLDGWFIILLLGLASWGCAPPRQPLVVSNPDPAVKIPAMKKAVREKNLATLRQLIRDLDSEDPAVRLYAINALERLTGERRGYQYFDDEVMRQPAVRQWQLWLQEQVGKEPASRPVREEPRWVGG